MAPVVENQEIIRAVPYAIGPIESMRLVLEDHFDMGMGFERFVKIGTLVFIMNQEF